VLGTLLFILISCLLLKNIKFVELDSKPEFHEKTKHIEINCSFSKRKLLLEELCTGFISSNN